MKKVSCPTCSDEVTWDDASPFRPFCSERCRLIDLGEWFGEGHRIPSEEHEGYELPENPEDDLSHL